MLAAGSLGFLLSKDLARSLSLVSIRVVETIPGKSCMGLEIPNPKREIQWTRRWRVSRSARVIAPTLDERERISETVIVSVPRGSASWILRSAT